MEQVKKYVIRFAEVIGLLLFILQIMLKMMMGQNFYEVGFDFAYSTLMVAIALRQMNEFFLIVTVFMLGMTWNHYIRKHRTDDMEGDWSNYQIISGILIGYLIGQWIFYSMLDSVFYRGVFVTIPYTIGMVMLLAVSIRFLTDVNLVNKIRNTLWNEKKSLFGWKKGDILKGVKIDLVILISLFLVVPNLVPMSGTTPEPETQPSEGYGSGVATYGFEVVKLDHELPEDISNSIDTETSHRLHQFDGWNVHLYVPDRNGTMPVAIYVHGYGAPYTLAYQDSLELLAERGALVIFPEYATHVKMNETGDADYSRGMTDDPRLGVRYNMHWTGVKMAYDYLMENEYDVDFSKIMVVGHSMGGGMSLWVSTKVAEQGWGADELIVDMEAPASTPKYGGYRGDMSALPNHTIVNIVGYENDHLVSPCIGMWHFERFRDRDGAGELPDASFMIIRSDHHGFPRMVASHYLPNAQAVDPLANWGYYKRIDAMADYLVMKVDGNGTGAGQARLYFTGGTNEMLDMGKWSDGRQMNRPHYSTDPFGLRGGDGLIEYIDEDAPVECETPTSD